MLGLSYTVEQIKHSRTESFICSNSCNGIYASSGLSRTHGCATTSKKLRSENQISQNEGLLPTVGPLRISLLFRPLKVTSSMGIDYDPIDWRSLGMLIGVIYL